MHQPTICELHMFHCTSSQLFFKETYTEVPLSTYIVCISRKNSSHFPEIKDNIFKWSQEMYMHSMGEGCM